MPTIPRNVRAFAFGLMRGVGGVSYTHRETSALLKERFGATVSPRTLRNWKSDMVNQMTKFSITEDYIQEQIGIGLSGSLSDNDTANDAPNDDPSDVIETPPKEDPSPGGDEPVVGDVPHFMSLAEMVGYMEGQGFIVATSSQDLRKILDSRGFQLFDKGALRYGPEIISLEPITLDFEAVGKQIGGNAVIMWYYGLARRLAELTGEKPPELVDYVTSCVVDAMVARKYNMALLIA